MAICKHCGQEMTTASSCLRVPVVSGGEEHEPVRYGAETRFGAPPSEKRCHDCWVEPGGYHHPGCDWEECPVCGRQLISCDCLDDADEEQRVLH